MIVYQVTNQETAMTAIVWNGIPGAFSVTLRDDDSGATLPTVGLTSSLELAKDMANKWADVRAPRNSMSYEEFQAWKAA